MTAPAPGWYPSPDGSGSLRWWDGRGWTEYVEHPPVPQAPVGSPVGVLQAERRLETRSFDGGGVRFLDGPVREPDRVRTPGLGRAVRLLAFGLVFAVLGVLMVKDSLASVHVGPGESSVVGTVVAQEHVRTKKGLTACLPAAAFALDGQQLRAHAQHSTLDCPKIGSSVTVVYTTASPDDGTARVADSRRVVVVYLLVILGGLVASGFGIRRLWVWSSARRRTA